MTKRVRLWWHEVRGHYILRTAVTRRRLVCLSCSRQTADGEVFPVARG